MKQVKNEDLIRKAAATRGVAHFRRFPTPRLAKEARNQLLRARRAELMGWALFSRGGCLYIMAPGAFPPGWDRHVVKGGVR